MTWRFPALFFGAVACVIAAPDPPVIYEPPLAVYSGDQSEGVWVFPTVTGGPLEITELRVENLTHDITPAPGKMGISIWHDGKHGAKGANSPAYDPTRADRGESGGTGQSLWPTFSGTPQAIHGSGNEHGIGIYAASLGGDGGAGGDGYGAVLTPGLGGHGGHGGGGGAITLVADGAISSTSPRRGHGILAISAGGKGGKGGGGYFGIPVDGGTGGRGGTGGNLHVTSSSTIHSLGRDSACIYLASHGGVSGDGGDGGGLFGGTGAGGIGGKGGIIHLDASGPLSTMEDSSPGILTQSIGGAAGAAGAGVGVVFWSGDGRSSGDGNTVNVSTSASAAIHTRGANSSGIEAQSIGGGGGKGGRVGGLYSLGGFGSAAGHGGGMTVQNAGPIRTEGPDSFGIMAQSIGGGGGTAGTTSALVSIGGDGKANGNGGALDIGNTGEITTLGDGSAGIIAYSIGGGGGLLLNRSAGGRANGLLFAQGGKGSEGGRGGSVTLLNSADIETGGVDACGILGGSLGGGGGAGGDGRLVGFSCASNRGGASGTGGAGGGVAIHHAAGSVTTTGDLSHGIHATSTGGGGGNGGNAVSFVTGLEMSSSTGFGGTGGGGGAGAVASILSQGGVATHGKQAHALFAQSVGGGGGSGGNVINWTNNLHLIENDYFASFSASGSLGGKGGGGGSGGEARVHSHGPLATSAADSLGMLVQSIGGGGGHGGNSMTGTLLLNSYAVSLAFGGTGGVAGHGGTVVAESHGGIATQGDFGHGILAQSVGGGGGAGGNSTSFIFDITIMTSLGDLIPAPVSGTHISVGGNSSVAGHGGPVDVLNTDAISTEGVFAHGMLAHSIGGGGGAAGDALAITTELGGSPFDDLAPYLYMMTDQCHFVLGGIGGSGGNGGTVRARNHGGISTHGDFSSGVVAQSIGGGGGAGGISREEEYDFMKPDPSSLPRIRTRSGGAGGTGADVVVENRGVVTTSGVFSHGIVAQSLGGGGGLAGIRRTGGHAIVDLSPHAAGLAIQQRAFGAGFAGSSGGSGVAGEVRVEHHGSVATEGEVSHGILAQSSARYGGENVIVNVFGNVTASGLDSDGIFAHGTYYGAYGEDVRVVVHPGATVRGGTGNGAGVRLESREGAVLSVRNGASVSATGGLAVAGGYGMNNVENRGLVSGNVALDGRSGHPNDFNNWQTGRFHCGPRVDLGESGLLWNHGVLSPGGPESVTLTVLTGAVILDPSGSVEIDIAGSYPGAHDCIGISGTLDIGYGHIGMDNFLIRDLGGLTAGTYKLVTSAVIYGSLNPANLSAPIGSRTGTLRINGGDLELVVTPAGPSAYHDWSQGPFAGTLHHADTTYDFDQGGLPNCVEWVLGGDPTDPSDDAALAPFIDLESDPHGKVCFIHRRSIAAHADPDTTIAVQYSGDMIEWHEALHHGTGPDDITITEFTDGFGPGIDMVVVALPPHLDNGGRLFIRLMVSVEQP